MGTVDSSKFAEICSPHLIAAGLKLFKCRKSEYGHSSLPTDDQKGTLSAGTHILASLKTWQSFRL